METLCLCCKAGAVEGLLDACTQVGTAEGLDLKAFGAHGEGDVIVHAGAEDQFQGSTHAVLAGQLEGFFGNTAAAYIIALVVFAIFVAFTLVGRKKAE